MGDFHTTDFGVSAMTSEHLDVIALKHVLALSAPREASLARMVWACVAAEGR
jgi:hypothetical protein